MTAPATDLTIRDFRPGDEADFRRLNEEWILRYFALESKDIEYLAEPRQNILDRGGRIFVAVIGGETVGFCSLLPKARDEFEVAKMVVAEAWRGNGIGRQILERVIAESRDLGARRLYLETNRKLANAVRLYESVGFRHIPPERVVPSPYARANVFMELCFEL
jgi:putative acetyltransferase